MHRLPLFILATAPLCSPALSQQELVLLDESGQVWRIDNYTTATAGHASAVLLGQFAAPGGGGLRDFAVDPDTDDFWVHAVSAGGLSQILHVDAGTYQAGVACTSMFNLVDGLDINSGGWLVFETLLTTLVFLDPGTCETIVVPTGALAGNTSFASTAFDERGFVATNNFDGWGFRIDPYSGARSVLPMQAFTFVRSFEVEEDGSLLVLLSSGDLYRRDPSGVWHHPFDGAPGMAGAIGLALSTPSDAIGAADVCSGAPNSGGTPGTLDLIGSTAASANDFELRARSLPARQSALFVMGTAAGALPVGQGTLCVAPPFTRIVTPPLNTGAQGAVILPLDLTHLPTGGAAMAGDTYLFQLWHRDVGGTSNLSNARAVTF